PSPPSSRLRLRRVQAGGPGSVWTSQTFPLRSVAGQMQYWPFSASDLYNWKTHNPSFSQDPQALTGLIESILLTRQPTWDDCQQLLQTLLTTEEKQRVYLEARKNVPGADGRPTLLPNEIEEAFPLTRPDWDYTTVAGRERLRLYRQILLAGLRGAGKRPTNLAKVRAVVQGAEETPAGFLERLMEAYRMYTPFDPLAEDRQGDVIMSFIGQSAPDIRNKLQRLEGLQGYTIQDLMARPTNLKGRPFRGTESHPLFTFDVDRLIELDTLKPEKPLAPPGEQEDLFDISPPYSPRLLRRAPYIPRFPRSERKDGSSGVVRLGDSGPSLAGIHVVRHTVGDSVGDAGPAQVPVDNAPSPPAVSGTGPHSYPDLAAGPQPHREAVDCRILIQVPCAPAFILDCDCRLRPQVPD
ncbi:LOW QUALITY PROTEIN: uncharacterized protein LOC133754984, partial [Lepus europaeus]|uniref:LOW QUALITY PROTEIN: uncharacterized protein LOC133754984 n=1 Tax=Lepus europaeus TaxID=9983 RepID=UPI002B46CC96